ncbi:hypothetical protein [Frankia sp. AgB32]|uniref:hypothetical protein n=1 Tax=Frankia sp. AgB32 TaxID=631119 RepID=UPI00200DC31F|nr:hypothetical protein [Frankia sp. AgB32]MCK9894297.1 hypothetical protein [Frankia sp. AgB32]
MRFKKIGLAAATVATAAGLTFGAATAASASTGLGLSTSTGVGSSTGVSTGLGANGLGLSLGTALSVDEVARVTAVVKAKGALDSVTSVRRNPDGSYLVVGTKAGATVTEQVSADLQTVTRVS